MKIYILASALFAAMYYVNGQSCTTVNGDWGNCITVDKCPSLIQVVTKSNKTQADVEMLRKAACGFEGKRPKVCCPLLKGKEREKCESIITTHPPDPKTGCCGTQTADDYKLIRGGPGTLIDEFPWLTLIEYLNRQNKIKTLCSGTLISNKYVLTAAHCLTDRVLDVGTPKNVRLGEYDTSNDGLDCVEVDAGGLDCTDGTFVIPIEKIIAHAEYNPRTRQHDIGLVRMQKAAPYTDFIRPICLPTDDVTEKPPPRFKLFGAGWDLKNSNSKKLRAELPFVDQTECQPAYNVKGRNITLGKGQMCAGGKPDSCKGSALMYQNGRTHELLGVSGFGPILCGNDGVPEVYTKVIEYVSWIKSNIEP